MGTPLRLRVLYYVKRQLSLNSIHFREQNYLLPNFSIFYFNFFMNLYPIFRGFSCFLDAHLYSQKTHVSLRKVKSQGCPAFLYVYFFIYTGYLLYFAHLYPSVFVWHTLFLVLCIKASKSAQTEEKSPVWALFSQIVCFPGRQFAGIQAQ